VAVALLTSIVGMGLLAGSAYLYVAEYTADVGRPCGSLNQMSEAVHYTPPNDGGCGSAKDWRVVEFLASAVAGVLLLVGGLGGALWLTLRASGPVSIGGLRIEPRPAALRPT